LIISRQENKNNKPKKTNGEAKLIRGISIEKLHQTPTYKRNTNPKPKKIT
jgi:hypothetical protein